MEQTPKYKIIEDYIKDQIEQKIINVGDQIMTEDQLSQHFGFSRMTINKAINNLCEQGFIKRIPGKGSFVTRPKLVKSVSQPTSFSEDMLSIGLKPGAKILSYKIIKASEIPEIAEKLHLSGDDYIHYFIRLRTGDNTPIAISNTYISAKIIPAIDISSLEGSFYKYLYNLGLHRTKLFWDIMATIPTKEQRELLNITQGAILKICHVTYCIHNGDEVPFEYIETNYNSDIYTYRLQTNEN